MSMIKFNFETKTGKFSYKHKLQSIFKTLSDRVEIKNLSRIIKYPLRKCIYFFNLNIISYIFSILADTLFIYEGDILLKDGTYIQRNSNERIIQNKVNYFYLYFILHSKHITKYI